MEPVLHDSRENSGSPVHWAAATCYEIAGSRHGMDKMEIAPASIGDTELAQLVRRFAEARVLVLGDIMLDRYVSGSASRLSPEAPIPVLRPTNRRATLGGAANVALNIVTLGGQASLVGVIGDDAAARELSSLLGSSGIVPHLVVSPARPTTAKTRFMV